MGGVQGIGGSPGPADAGPANGRIGLHWQAPAFDPADGVEISNTARQAALAAKDIDLRQQRVEEVQARIQEGAYKLQAALLKVAARVAPYIE
jgi:hypothetical protein